MSTNWKAGEILRPRLMSKFVPMPYSGCWIWTGSRDAYGYGMLSVLGKRFKAHRVSYSLHKGEIAPKMDICHKCDTPACVNPDHLFQGTRSDNMKDAVSKGRARMLIPAGENHPDAILSFSAVEEIKASRLSSRKEAAIRGVSHTSILHARNGKTWRKSV